MGLAYLPAFSRAPTLAGTTSYYGSEFFILEYVDGVMGKIVGRGGGLCFGRLLEPCTQGTFPDEMCELLLRLRTILFEPIMIIVIKCNGKITIL